MSTASVNLTEAKQHLGEIVNRAAYGGERIVLFSRGKPRAALVSVEDLRLLESLGENERELRRAHSRAWLEEARTLRKRILTRRGGIPLPDSAEELDALREERDEQILGLC